MKGLAILGSTGSIGTQTLDVVRCFPDRLSIVGLAAHRNIELLTQQCLEFKPQLVSCDASRSEKAVMLSSGCVETDMADMAINPHVDLLVTATVGEVALGPTIAAMKAGKDVAMANKESIICAGALLTKLSKKHRSSLIPLDSEPNAIWQCLRGEDRTISRLIITGSGGPFRGRAYESLSSVSPEEALNHPTWKMGRKITVDSATLMNKAFEVIEAHYLFDVPWNAISVVIHPQSIVHSMVEFVDGSIKALLGPPDMRLPIQYGLLYPDRMHNEKFANFDPTQSQNLTFEQLDVDQYPCFAFALEVAKRGGSWPSALCGANDMAVELFLAKKIGFLDIIDIIKEAVSSHDPVVNPSLEEILSVVNWAKSKVRSIAK